jgi:probable rRNA maturation factor
MIRVSSRVDAGPVLRDRPPVLAFTLIVEDGQEGALNASEVQRRVRVICRALRISRKTGSIVLVDDDQIHKLNKTYRNKNRPTDVLAFAMQEGEFREVSPLLLGDVVVSVPTAAKQALRAKRPVLEEITMLIAHGLLHLLGWDHDTVEKDKAMRVRTDDLCRLARAPGEKRSPQRKRALATQSRPKASRKRPTR